MLALWLQSSGRLALWHSPAAEFRQVGIVAAGWRSGGGPILDVSKVPAALCVQCVLTVNLDTVLQ
jgi:hypothetical protein